MTYIFRSQSPVEIFFRLGKGAAFTQRKFGFCAWMTPGSGEDRREDNGEVIQTRFIIDLHDACDPRSPHPSDRAAGRRSHLALTLCTCSR